MAEALTNLSEELAAAVAKAGSSVVRVEARRRMSASGIVWSADGLIVTAHHVVERDEGVTVGLPDGGTATATLVGRDPTTDIAVLRTQAQGISAPAWADPDALRVGHIILALGRLGRSVRAAFGIVSAIGGSWRTAAGGQLDRYWQPDVAMFPGFSGGPLINASGEVLGIGTSALQRNTTTTIALPDLRRTVETLLAHGKVRRGYLGVVLQAVRLPDSFAQQLGQETGLLVMSIEPGSAAERGGLFMGDTLVGAEDERVRTADDLAALLSGDRVGQQVKVRILRGGTLQELSLVVGEHV